MEKLGNNDSPYLYSWSIRVCITCWINKKYSSSITLTFFASQSVSRSLMHPIRFHLQFLIMINRLLWSFLTLVLFSYFCIIFDPWRPSRHLCSVSSALCQSVSHGPFLDHRLHLMLIGDHDWIYFLHFDTTTNCSWIHNPLDAKRAWLSWP